MFVVNMWFLVVMYDGIGGVKTPRVEGRYTTKAECVLNMPKNRHSNCIYSEYHVYKDEI